MPDENIRARNRHRFFVNQQLFSINSGRPYAKGSVGVVSNVASKLFPAKPRGFCAGVARAIDTVTAALELSGAPVYVRKQLVHDDTAVDALSVSSAVFGDEIDKLPEGARLILSAHHAL